MRFQHDCTGAHSSGTLRTFRGHIRARAFLPDAMLKCGRSRPDVRATQLRPTRVQHMASRARFLVEHNMHRDLACLVGAAGRGLSGFHHGLTSGGR
eukprot:15477031-Alexandrium_andersonii.AAC.1